MYRSAIALGFSFCLSFFVCAKPVTKVVESQMIAVAKHKMHFNLIPGSQPAIVFESGSGVDSSHWHNIITTLSTQLDNAIISYDRAGYGQSELPAEPYNIESEVLWLRQGLEQLGYAESIVYVGHSYGFYLLKMYEAKYRASLSAMVYIDPITIDFIDAIGGIEQELKHFDPSLLPDNRLGRALLRETKGVAETYGKVKRLPFSKAVNCFVISAENPGWSSKEEVARWKSGQQTLSSQCGNEVTIAKGSHHDVPTHSPELIVNTLVSILE